LNEKKLSVLRKKTNRLNEKKDISQDNKVDTTELPKLFKAISTSVQEGNQKIIKIQKEGKKRFRY